jgi:hypothetical protein
MVGSGRGMHLDIPELVWRDRENTQTVRYDSLQSIIRTRDLPNKRQEQSTTTNTTFGRYIRMLIVLL